MLEKAQKLIEAEQISFEIRLISDDGEIKILNLPEDDKKKDTDRLKVKELLLRYGAFQC